MADEEFRLNNNISFAAPDGIIVINREKRIIVFNDSAQRITNFSEEEIISKNLSYLFSNKDDIHVYFEKALNDEQSFSNLSIDINCKNIIKNVMISITPLRQPGKGIIGIIVVFRDTNEMIELVKRLQEKNKEILDQKNKLEAIFNNRLEGTLTINNDFVITSINSAAERITGYKGEEALGKKYWEILKLSPPLFDAKKINLSIEKRFSTSAQELFLIRKDAVKIPVRLNTVPLFDSEKKIIGVVTTFQDISEIKNLSLQLEEKYKFQNIIGSSKPMQIVFQLMQNVIESDSTVLITGDSGTGKEIVARAIHLNSSRKANPFIAINCNAFVETLLESELFGHEKGAFTGAIQSKPGRFELAGEGTLFLDEIGDISPTIQVKLLRVIENRQFERVGGTKTLNLKARLITATNKDLEKEVKKGNFREDLFYRINVININLPKLKERLEDLPDLVNYFLNKFNAKFNKNIKGFSSSSFNLLQKYDWPGNIRELENAIEHAFVVCPTDVIETEHLPERIWNALSNDDYQNHSEKSPLKNAEKNLILGILKKNKGNRKKTAKELGIDKTTLWRKMKKFGLL